MKTWSWLEWLAPKTQVGRRSHNGRRATVRLHLEPLEDRLTPAVTTGYQGDLVFTSAIDHHTYSVHMQYTGDYAALIGQHVNGLLQVNVTENRKAVQNFPITFGSQDGCFGFQNGLPVNSRTVGTLGNGTASVGVNFFPIIPLVYGQFNVVVSIPGVSASHPSFPWPVFQVPLFGIHGYVSAQAPTTVAEPLNAQVAGTFKALVTDQYGILVYHAPLTFQIRPGTSGASGAFIGGALTTTVNTDGASPTVVPPFFTNGIAGTFTVAAFIAGEPYAGQANFTVTNTSTVTAPTNAGATFNTSARSVTLTTTITDSLGRTVSGGNVIFTVQGIGLVSGTVNRGIASATISVPGGTHAGSYAITALYSGTNTFSSSSGTGTLRISKAAPTVRVVDSGGVYTGLPFPAVATVAGTDGRFASTLEGVGLSLDYLHVNANGTLTDLGSSPPLGVGNYRVVALFPGSTDYVSASNSASFTISQNYPATINSVTLPTAGIEGVPVSGRVIFRDSDGDAHTVSISWGDGQTQNLSLGAGVTQFSISHTYAEERAQAYSVRIIVADAGGTAIANAQVLVADAVPVLTSYNPQFIEGLPYTGVLATFTDTGDDHVSTIDYSAMINWGDGHASSGIVGRLDNGTLAVFSDPDHVYSGDEGTAYSLAIEVDDVGGARGFLTIPVTITDPVLAAPIHLQVNDDSFGTNVITIQAYRGAADEIQPDDIRVTQNGSTLYSGNIESLADIAVNGIGATDIINIQGTYATVPVYINLAGGTTNIFVTASRQLVGAAQGNITIQGGGLGTTALDVDDKADGLPASWLLDQGLLAGDPLGQAVVSYDALTSLTMRGGAAPNVFGVRGTSAGSTTIHAGPKNDRVNIGDATHNLDAISALSVQGGTGTVLTLDDEANANGSIARGAIDVSTNPTFLVSDRTVTRSNVVTQTVHGTNQVLSVSTLVATIGYDHLDRLDVVGGQTGNVFDIQSTDAATSTALMAGAGDDVINVGSGANTLEKIKGPLSVDGQGGSNTLNIQDQGTSSRQEYDVYFDRIARSPLTTPPSSPTETILYSGMGNVAVHGGSGADVLAAFSTLSGTSVDLFGGSGGNQLFVSNAFDTMDDIHGPVALHGGSSADVGFFVDSLNTAGHGFTLTAKAVQRSDLAAISYDGLGELVLGTGNGADTINVSSTAAKVFTVVVAGNGDTVTLGKPAGLTHTLQDFAGIFRVQSSAAESPAVVIDDSGNPDITARTIVFGLEPGVGNFIEGLSPQRIYLQTGAGSSVSVLGSGADETFTLESLPAAVQVGINGEGGTNTLDYSSFLGDVTVNLPLGTATGLAMGISNIQNVKGGIGNDLIVGDSNVNILLGGSGRNILIGGGGADQLVGGNDDNILIGGTTSYDQSRAALDLIMQEWLQPSNFSARMDALQMGTDLLDGTGIELSDTTIQPDGAANTLLPGTGNNWVIP